MTDKGIYEFAWKEGATSYRLQGLGRLARLSGRCDGEANGETMISLEDGERLRVAASDADRSLLAERLLIAGQKYPWTPDQLLAMRRDLKAKRAASCPIHHVALEVITVRVLNEQLNLSVACEGFAAVPAGGRVTSCTASCHLCDCSFMTSML